MTHRGPFRYAPDEITGRKYEQAVQMFEPYRLIQEPNEGMRRAMVEIIGGARKRKKPAFLIVNNRAEGFAPGTIQAVPKMVGRSPA